MTAIGKNEKETKTEKMEMITRKPMPLYVRFEKYNNNNEHEYDPYVVSATGNLIIDATWWKSLTNFVQSKIMTKCPSFELVDHLNVPHALCPSHDSLTTIYWAYLEGFDYQHWYSPNIPNGPKDVVLIRLSDEAKDSLRLNTRNGDDPALAPLKHQINAVCQGKEYFVRLSGTSGKNEKPLRPFKCADDIVTHLAQVDQFRHREYLCDDNGKPKKETYLVLIPWNEAIDSRCEFRIFVVEGKLTAASPQKFWELHQYSCDELESFQTALSNISFIDYFPYKTFVADVYIDVATSICHLIELNPFGAHCGAGASFFNWIDDYDLLHGLAPSVPEIRYLSAINY